MSQDKPSRRLEHRVNQVIERYPRLDKSYVESAIRDLGITSVDEAVRFFGNLDIHEDSLSKLESSLNEFDPEVKQTKGLQRPVEDEIDRH